ncbi:MAG TPA: sigma-54-dependent Fis family transcriptional regulator, partial [Alphaproteobacteria bacterium]|nr:sigma-54-dependent Fis family transcriptional regulator [Alphaproteobacteria bacterium]
MYYNVLVVDDDQFQCKTIQLALEKMLSYNVQTINSGAEAIELITSEEGNKINMVILDLSMPEIDGLDVLRAICPQRPELPIIINTAYGDVKKAVEALKLGAVDFIEKQDGFERIKICIENVRLRSGLVREVKKLHQHSKNLYSFDDIIGKSSILQKSINQAKKAALSNIPVFISGESGVGKEMFARAIHCSSSRANKPFISVNCSAIPENLVESVLFGHEKGA